jgi:hypothetical protein
VMHPGGRESRTNYYFLELLYLCRQAGQALADNAGDRERHALRICQVL